MKMKRTRLTYLVLMFLNLLPPAPVLQKPVEIGIKVDNRIYSYTDYHMWGK